MSLRQLDLFEIADENERKAVYASNDKTAEKLSLGDIIHVKWNNGVEWEGVYTGLKGFWDNRPEFREWVWIYATKVSHGGEWESTRQYTHVDLARDEWCFVGRDEMFTLPVKEEIETRLVERLSQMPFKARLNTYHGFESEMPTHSYDYHPWVSKAWHSAISTVTTIDEFLEQEKDWTCKLDLPKPAVNYVTNVVFIAEPQKRVDLIKQMRWVRNEYADRFYMEFPEQRDITYYKALHNQFVQEARTPKELVSIVRMRGGQTRFVDGKPTAKFWIEQ